MLSAQSADSSVDLLRSDENGRMERVSFLYKFSSSALSRREKQLNKGRLPLPLSNSLIVLWIEHLLLNFLGWDPPTSQQTL